MHHARSHLSPLWRTTHHQEVSALSADLNPDFPFRILSRSFGEKSEDFSSPKLQDKIQNRKPGQNLKQKAWVRGYACIASLPTRVFYTDVVAFTSGRSMSQYHRIM